MKKVILMMMMAVAVVACSNSPQELELPQTEKDVIGYARQHVGEMVEGETFTIDGIDTLLSDDIPALKADECSVEANEVLGDVYITWKRYRHELESVRMKPQYDGYWRLVYKVGVGNATIRILMDSTGTVPVMTEDEFCERMNKLKCNGDGSGLPKFHF